MRILLTLPPSIHDLEIYRVTGMKAPPLGLAYIASMLEQAGHKVKIIDTATLEIGVDRWLTEIKSWKPDIVGFSLLTPTAPRGYKAVKLLRDKLGWDFPVFAGGMHPSFMYEEAIRNGFDIVVIGEGEITAVELMSIIEKHGLDKNRLSAVKGIAYRDANGSIRVTQPRKPLMDLDKIPWPARHLLPMDKYTLFGKPIRIAHVMASRGCPYGCIYCSTSYFWGRRVRIRSAENVADEIEYLVNKYKVKQIVFADDELTLVRRFVYKLVEELKLRGIDIGFACGGRVDHVDRDFLRFLFKNGCIVIYFGVESASQETLNRIGKKITLDQARKAFRLVREVNGFATASFILGFPWERIEDMKRTVDFAVKLDPDYAQFTVLTPYPGTPMYGYALENNLIEDWNWEHYTTIRPVMRGFHFTREQLKSMIKYAYRKFYLRLGFVKRELRAGRLGDLIGILYKELFSWTKDFIIHHLRWR